MIWTQVPPDFILTRSLAYTKSILVAYTTVILGKMAQHAPLLALFMAKIKGK